MATDTAQGLEPVWVWGLPLAPLTFGQTLDRVEDLIKAKAPAYFITANLHYAMLTDHDKRLAEVNAKAAFVLADGMPLVWASWWRPRCLPERVAGSDLVPALCERAAQKGYRVFLLGGPPGVAEEAARKLCERFPGLQVVGTECPPFRELSAEEQAGLCERIRVARPDLLFVAFGQPKGELWLAAHGPALGVPACAQIGATLDFIAGRVRRSPRWLQRIGLEWAYRLCSEPARLTGRYARNFLFALKMGFLDLVSPSHRKR
ncbi:MAG TPA: WecB/TagA/CpsF family glycosyltransferase [Gemmataceae bacterium]|nr:WecB/TagA/CpsF family glycosyltransferase [Gemmataceae bacterium]